MNDALTSALKLKILMGELAEIATLGDDPSGRAVAFQAHESLATLLAERDDLDHQLAQHVIALRDMRDERDAYKRALEGNG